jgi:hypothetical protein
VVLLRGIIWPMSLPLHESLLRGDAVASGRRPGSPWAYSLWGILVVSVFVLYHASVLLVWNLPGKGLVKNFHSTFLEQTKAKQYFGGTRLNQSWAMFAPNPNRTNNFVHVYVEDFDGGLWDYEQDIWGEDRYPYLWYSRMGKINRRIDNKKHFQRMYGAWVCREWERRNGGQPAKSVAFVRRVTRVPHSQEVLEAGGWDQWQAPFEQTEQETINCKTVQHGQLPNELRIRYGFEPRDEDEEKRVFRDISLRSWWDKAEDERKRAEREAEQAARLGLPPPERPRDRDDDGEPVVDDEDQ